MSNEYKKTLARFEQAVRNHEMKGTYAPADWDGIQREYEESKQALIRKLNYRQLSAEKRVRQEKP